MVISVAAGLGFPPPLPRLGGAVHIAIASLIMPGLSLVSLGIGLLFNQLGWVPTGTSSALGAQLTWTLPFGLLIMFAVLQPLQSRLGRSRQAISARPPGSACGM